MFNWMQIDKMLLSLPQVGEVLISVTAKEVNGSKYLEGRKKEQLPQTADDLMPTFYEIQFAVKDTGIGIPRDRCCISSRITKGSSYA
jgi:hypothetical protein